LNENGREAPSSVVFVATAWTLCGAQSGDTLQVALGKYLENVRHLLYDTTRSDIQCDKIGVYLCA
jgi:hypothetical protein